jgi:hypothetical protein
MEMGKRALALALALALVLGALAWQAWHLPWTRLEFFKSLLLHAAAYIPVRTTASSCNPLDIPSTHFDTPYSTAVVLLSYCHTTTVSAIPLSPLHSPPFSSTRPPTHTHGQQQYERSHRTTSKKSQYCTKHASRYRQHGRRRVMIGSVCRTTPAEHQHKHRCADPCASRSHRMRQKPRLDSAVSPRPRRPPPLPPFRLLSPGTPSNPADPPLPHPLHWSHLSATSTLSSQASPLRETSTQPLHKPL